MTTPAPGINIVSWLDIASTPPVFTLAGGTYQFAGVASGWGTATLEVLGPDDSTFLPIGAALSANGYLQFQVGAGQTCQLALSGVTAFYGSISQIPLSPAL